jgi:hypothetical protein
MQAALKPLVDGGEIAKGRRGPLLHPKCTRFEPLLLPGCRRSLIPAQFVIGKRLAAGVVAIVQHPLQIAVVSSSSETKSKLKPRSVRVGLKRNAPGHEIIAVSGDRCPTLASARQTQSKSVEIEAVRDKVAFRQTARP